MELNTNRSVESIFDNAKPYENEEEWVDDCRTLEEFARCLATAEKEIAEGKYNN